MTYWFLFFITPMEVFKDVLEELHLPKEELKMDEEDIYFYGNGKHRLKIFDRFVKKPWEATDFVEKITKPLLLFSDSLWVLSYFPFARIDEGVRRGLIQRPERVLAYSVKRIENPKEQLKNILENSFGVEHLPEIPDTLVSFLLMLFIQIKETIEWTDSAFSEVSEIEIEKLKRSLLEEDEYGISNREMEEIIEKVDFKYLSAGFMDLCFVLQYVIQGIKDYSGADIFFETKYGKCFIGGKGKNTYKGKYLLLIDYGGNDEYIDAGVAGRKNPISIIIDFSGDDKYIGEKGPATAITGFSVVIDYKGDDIYIAENTGIGAGILGQGILLDLSGNDKYVTDLYGEGTGLLGTGVLSDIKGNDVYIGFHGIQGFGFVKGAGILIDREGNDRYIARDDTIKYPSPQTKKHNTSLSQGAGFGIRADFTDGHSIAGGIGILIDGGGDDYYSCGVFGQGVGYWFGTGILVDWEGNDEYHGTWYVQGAGAHFAVGILMDKKGNDHYNAEINMAQGAGHDFTLGIFVDYRGDDVYISPNLSLGAGNANGMGLFFELEGNDTYRTKGITLGRANIGRRGGLRDLMKCIGIFVDAEGKDNYNVDFAGNKKIWRQRQPGKKIPLDTEISIGIDM